MNNVVEVSSNNAAEALKWAKAHCPNYITNGARITQDGEVVYDFYFVPNTPDIILFTLQWGGTVVDLDW